MWTLINPVEYTPNNIKVTHQVYNPASNRHLRHSLSTSEMLSTLTRSGIYNCGQLKGDNL